MADKRPINFVRSAHNIIMYMTVYVYLMTICWGYSDINFDGHFTWYNIELNASAQYCHIYTCYITKFELGI